MYWCYVQRGKFTEGDASRKGLRDKCQGGKSFSPPYIPLLFCPIFFSTNASFIHPHSSLLSPSNLLPPVLAHTLFFPFPSELLSLLFRPASSSTYFPFLLTPSHFPSPPGFSITPPPPPTPLVFVPRLCLEANCVKPLSSDTLMASSNLYA